MSSRIDAFLFSLKREIALFARSRIYLLLSLLLPIFSFFLFIALFGNGVARELPVALYDADRTPLSRKLTGMIDATPTVAIAMHCSSLAEARVLLEKGRVEAVVEIPPHLEKSVLRGDPIDVSLQVSGLSIIKGSLITRDIRTAVATFSSGIQIQSLVKRGMSPEVAYTRMMPVTFDKHILFNPWLSYTFYLLPAFLSLMLLMFVTLVTIFTVGVELKNGTAGEWLAGAGNHVSAALFGKLLPYTVIFSILSVGMHTLTTFWADVPLRGSAPMLFVSTFLLITAYQSVGCVIVALSANMRLALSLGGGYSVLAFSFSGLTFPAMAMDLPARIAGNLFPFTHYLQIWMDQALRGAAPHHSVSSLLVLVAFSLLFLLFLGRLKTVLTDEKYWGAS